MNKLSVQDAVNSYYKSSDFNMLGEKSKVDYQYCIGVMLSTKIDSKKLGDMNVNKLTGNKARRAYEEWLGSLLRM